MQLAALLILAVGLFLINVGIHGAGILPVTAEPRLTGTGGGPAVQ